ncbi:hypothetical protein [uncultured Roseobacter sp.]|uniref:hypothetical protein n=1 Tax=uncultured Roseobacter sp. TaxID=114847 RepID=UPI00261ECB02|nr:hypothetical protein [uncultured Roseobacter sp.]
MLEFDIVRSIAPFVKYLEDCGFDILPVDNFDRVLDLVPETGRKSQTPIMDVRRLDFTRSQAFWLFLVKDGVAVAGIACKIIDLTGENFGSYFQRVAKGQYDTVESPVRSVAQPILDEVEGKVIYFGELEIHERSRGDRALLSSFARLAKGLSAMRWPEFDWMCAIIPDNHFALAKDYGFTWVIPNAFTWRDPVPHRMGDTHWLMANKRSHYEHEVLVGRLQSSEQKRK